ncbi:hypothetical protein K378_05065 [Streptomyces sp. Amel2xB2]|nr:hypothetical protein K378_05065 [Streptomyces sp. Amel2xB2]
MTRAGRDATRDVFRTWMLTSRRHIDLLRVCSAVSPLY